MKNERLNLNKSTVANLSSAQMLNVQGGLGGYASSKSDCCISKSKGLNPGSSARRCCSCPAETPDDVHGTGG